MSGYLSLVLHAHLPFVRHPEHERFLEESWLYEAITETYLPLLQVMEGWRRDGMRVRLTLTLSPTLCAMLQDPLLKERYQRHLNALIQLADKETYRTQWEPGLQPLARMYHEHFQSLLETYTRHQGNLLGAFRHLQEVGSLEIITTAATHALLPLMVGQPSSVRGQVLTARDHYRSCFGRDPRGFWLPECAYAEGLDEILQEAGIRWVLLDSHGLLQAHPAPKYGVFAPVYSPRGLAVFGRDLESAKQVWSREEGYPGDSRYRDFYRDIGFDLDFDYVRPCLPSPDHRGFTGIKYHRITGPQGATELYDRAAALQAAADHAGHFLQARLQQVSELEPILEQAPVLVAPYDAELFGHWWYEGPEFLDYLVRKIYYDQTILQLATPSDYLQQHASLQICRPGESSWGEEGYWRNWLNETNEWIQPHLRTAEERMSELTRRFPSTTGLKRRALQQAARELLLAESSDWPFILRTGTNPGYATRRVKGHLLRFLALYEQLMGDQLDAPWLRRLEDLDNLFPDVDYLYWR